MTVGVWMTIRFDRQSWSSCSILSDPSGFRTNTTSFQQPRGLRSYLSEGTGVLLDVSDTPISGVFCSTGMYLVTTPQ